MNEPIDALRAVMHEREYQRVRWAGEHDGAHDYYSWIAVLNLQMGKLADAAFLDNADEVAFAASKVAAVALAIIENTGYSADAFNRPGRGAVS